MSFGQTAFASLHEPHMIRSIAFDFVWPPEGEIKERLGFLLIVTGGDEFLGDIVPWHKGARQSIEVITWKSAWPGRTGNPTPLADEIKFLMMLDHRPAAGRHVVRLVRKALLEAELRAELKDKLFAAARARNMPAPLISGEIARFDLR